MRTAINAQIEELRAQGWKVEMAEPATTGFPFILRQNLGQISVIDPEQTSLELDNLTLKAKAYWPGYASVLLPRQPIKVIAEGAPLYLQFDNAVVDLNLRPGTALELQNLTLTSGPWQINDASGNLLTAQDLTLSILQGLQSTQTYDFNVHASDLTPGDLIRAALNVRNNTPLTFDAYTARGATRLDRPLDRNLISGATVLPETFTLETAEITWGDLSVNATADLAFDNLGVPEGQLVTSVKNWRILLNYARAAGVISEQQETQSGLMLGIFANMSGTPDDLTLTVHAANGQINVNGVGLGPAPAFFTR
jgi:hypothetical protein